MILDHKRVQNLSATKSRLNCLPGNPLVVRLNLFSHFVGHVRNLDLQISEPDFRELDSLFSEPTIMMIGAFVARKTIRASIENSHNLI